MIREFKSEDMDNIIKILNKGFIFDESDIKEISQDENKTLLVYEDSEIKGFVYLKPMNIEEKAYRVMVYVDPDYRRKGIGTALYNSISTKLEEVKPNQLSSYFRVDKEDPNEFYRKLGYKKWWGFHEAYYKGSYQPEVDLTFVPYEDKHFGAYSKLIQDCFYELRKENDIKPYIVPFNEKDKEYLSNNKDFIYVSLKEGELISAVFVKNGYLDSITISPSHQGNGLGKKATQFAINKALEQNPNSVHLSVLVWNKKAVKLYEDLGFEIKQTVHFYRQLFDIEF